MSTTTRKILGYWKCNECGAAYDRAEGEPADYREGHECDECDNGVMGSLRYPSEQTGLIAEPYGPTLRDGSQPWAVFDGRGFGSSLLAAGLSKERAQLFAASEELLAAVRDGACINGEKQLTLAETLRQLAAELPGDRMSGLCGCWSDLLEAKADEIERAIGKAAVG